MTNQRHSLRPRHPGSCQFRHHGNAGAVEGRHPRSVAVDLRNEMCPVATGPHAGDPAHGGIPRIDALLRNEALKQRDQIGMQGGCVPLARLCVECDGAPFEIDVVVEVQPSLKAPTALMDGHLKRDVEHVFNGRVLDPSNLTPYESYVLSCEGLLSFGAMLSDTEPDARVGLYDAPINGLLHEDAENVDFIKRGVMAGLPATVWGRNLRAPRHIVEATLASQGLGAAHLPLMEEQAEGLPAIEVEAHGPNVVPIPQLDPLRDPAPPAASVVVTGNAPAQLLGGALGLQCPSPADIDSHVMAKARADVSSFVRAVSEADPEERASFIQITHIAATRCNTVGGSR